MHGNIFLQYPILIKNLKNYNILLLNSQNTKLLNLLILNLKKINKSYKIKANIEFKFSILYLLFQR